jgi:hypothetical protein
MKTILAGVVLTALLVQPVFAQSQHDGLHASGVYLKQDKKFRGDIQEPFFSAQPTPNQDPTEQGLCATAPGFCPDYHGENG